MYLLHQTWTRGESLRFSFVVSFVPWTLLALALLFLTSGPIQLELGLLGSGFLALGFGLGGRVTAFAVGSDDERVVLGFGDDVEGFHAS